MDNSNEPHSVHPPVLMHRKVVFIRVWFGFDKDVGCGNVAGFQVQREGNAGPHIGIGDGGIEDLNPERQNLNPKPEHARNINVDETYMYIETRVLSLMCIQKT